MLNVILQWRNGGKTTIYPSNCHYDAQTGYFHYSYIDESRRERIMIIEHEYLYQEDNLVNTNRIAKVIVNL